MKILKYFIILFCVVGLNVIALQYDYHWDLTAAKSHTLTDKTKSFLGKVSDPVEIVVFYSGLVPKYLQDLLQQYEDESSYISTEIVDPVRQISYAAQFGDFIDASQRKVIFVSQNNRKEFDFTDAVLSEEMINNGLIRLSAQDRTVCFSVGHGEYAWDDEGKKGLSEFAALLKNMNMQSENVLINEVSQNELNENCDLLIIAGPSYHLALTTQDKIQKYLKNGGDALILVENVLVSTPDDPLSSAEINLKPSLNSILQDWGILIGDDIVVDLSNHISGDVGIPATRNYQSHSALIKDLDYTFYIRPRSISLLPDRRATVKVAPFVLTASKQKSWAETNRYLKISYEEGVDRPGPVPISFVIWEPKTKNDASDTRLIVFTDVDFLSNAYLSLYSNAQMGLNVVSWLVESDYQAFAENKSPVVHRVGLTSRQKMIVFIVLGFLSLLPLIVGLLVWLRRR